MNFNMILLRHMSTPTAKLAEFVVQIYISI